jgi:hypothetical protein
MRSFTNSTKRKPPILKQNKIYIRYNDKANIDYTYLFLLYSIAEYNIKTKCFNIIKYKSIEDLTKRLNANFGDNNISTSTVDRMLSNENYKTYFKHDKNQKQIELLNDIRNDKSNFIVLSKTATEFLILSNDNLLSKYYLYLVYYCGISKNKKTDSTAK